MFLDLKNTEPSTNFILVLPDYISQNAPGIYPYLEPKWGLPVSKVKPLKTKIKYGFHLAPVCIDKDILNKILIQLPYNKCILIPSRLPVWEWRQTFYDVITGESFFALVSSKH